MAGKMTVVKICVTFVFVLNVQVSCWTVDLAEMNRLNLEMETTEKSLESNDEEAEKNYVDDVYDAANYGDLEYQSYMEKKIHGVLYNGSIYLDGLRKAMADYRKRLENCSTATTTISTDERELHLMVGDTSDTDRRRSFYFEHSEIHRLKPQRAICTSRFFHLKIETASTTWLPENDPSDQTDQDPCRHVMAASDQVTKMSELALWATNELRERKFADNKDTAQREEEELLLKLAWFLDQLAQLTGYNPDPNEYQNPTSTASSPTETAEDISTTSNPDTMNPFEIMQSVENGPPLSKFPPKSSTPVKNVQKRSVDDMTHFVKNYLKYKVWNSDNSENNIKSSGSFEVKNEINTKSVQKRAVFVKKAIGLRPSTEKQARKFKTKKIFIKKPLNYFQKNNNVMAVKVVRKSMSPVKFVQKRSTYYEDYGLSRVPENPMQDISYYIKNKPGTMYDSSPVQVANVYDSLRKHFDVENIEMIRRFGSNVTLGIDNLLLGAIKSMSDAQ